MTFYTLVVGDEGQQEMLALEGKERVLEVGPGTGNARSKSFVAS